MVTSYPDFTHPDAQQRERELALEQEVMAVAAGLGADLVRVTAGQAHPETGRADGIAWAADGLCRLVESTRGLRVTPVYENHAKPGVWTTPTSPSRRRSSWRSSGGRPTPGWGSTSTPAMQRPLPKTRWRCSTPSSTAWSVSMRPMSCTGNAATFAADPLALLDEVIGRVVSVHASDSAVRGELRHVLLGTGVTPYPALFERLGGPAGMGGSAWRKRPSRAAPASRPQPASFGRHGERPDTRLISRSRPSDKERHTTLEAIRDPIGISV